MRSARTGSRRPALALVLAAAALALAPPLADAGRPVREARKAVDARNADIQNRAQRLRVNTWKRLGGKKAKTTRVVGAGDLSLIFRRPSRGLDKGLRSNRVFQLITTQLGHPDMVPAAVKFRLPGAVAEFQAGEELMVMADESARFRSADEAPAEWLDRIPEEVRVTAAVADLLTQYRDRKLANVLVNDRGDVRLIDPDSTFVSRKNRPAYRSQFYRGGRLGYRSRQDSAADLPAAARALVESLASASAADVMSHYGVDAEEAGVLQTRARDIRDRGLTAAAEAYVSTLKLKTPR